MKPNTIKFYGHDGLKRDMTTTELILVAKILKLAVDVGIECGPDDANDILNVFLDGRVFTFFVDHEGVDTEEIDSFLKDVVALVGDVTTINAFFDYGLNYEGDIQLQGRDY
jgi:hypothetical protein